VLERLAKGSLAPVLFVDDFVGSGDQFVKTWKRQYSLADGSLRSFSDFDGLLSFFYAPLVCTAKGAATVARDCPNVALRPAHLLSEEYSADHPESVLWPKQLRPSASSFIESASARAGIPSGRRFGYRGLALAFAFEHSTPDATLPLFYWEENGWIPLVTRR
jgi:hypothetical protein